MGGRGRTAVALLCLLALVLSLAAVAADGERVYLLAVNDKMADLPRGVRPMEHNGEIYLPYSAFDKAATGVDLGVYYGMDRAQDALTLYSAAGMLVFRIYHATCEDGQGNRMNFHAIRRNAIPYVPAAPVCAFFGLGYACLSTADRGTLVRVSSSEATMTDRVFLDLARQRMLDRYNAIVPTQTTPAPSVLPVPAVTPRPTATPDPEERERMEVYVALDLSECEEEWGTYPAGAPVLYLLSPDQLARDRDRVRLLLAAGGTVGLKVGGTDPREALEELERGNELLSHIARVRTRIAAPVPQLAGELAQAGWFCWRPSVTMTTVNGTLANLEGSRTPPRITLPCSPGESRTTQQILRRLLREEDYTLHRPLETDLGGG